MSLQKKAISVKVTLFQLACAYAIDQENSFWTLERNEVIKGDDGEEEQQPWYWVAEAVFYGYDKCAIFWWTWSKNWNQIYSTANRWWQLEQDFRERLEQQVVRCYILQENGQPRSYALLIKEDELRSHGSAYEKSMDAGVYIYIRGVLYRRQKHGLTLLRYVMQLGTEQISASYTDNSLDLFRKEGFRIANEDLEICMFP